MLFGIGLPYILAAVLTYRPRVMPLDTPMSLFGWRFNAVSFAAVDGVRLAGWWIPAERGPANRTVVLCHGLAGGKASQLFLARRLLNGGYNVLAFDFRAHGESSGQLTSFGALEGRDVLGAIHWLRATHPDACEKVVGLGVSTGAAALISAAGDASPDAQYIDAVAVCGTYGRFDSVIDTTTRDYIPRPLQWLVGHVGEPLASMQTGTDLTRFSPAVAVKALWPRPLLVIHGVDDEIIPFENGQALFDAALQPKYDFWIERAGHVESMTNPDAGRVIKRFFDEAGRVL